MVTDSQLSLNFEAIKSTALETVLNAQVIFVNHSGGKDSQAMLAYLMTIGFTGKMVIVHADLGEMEWEPMHDFISQNSFGFEVVYSLSVALYGCADRGGYAVSQRWL